MTEKQTRAQGNTDQVRAAYHEWNIPERFLLADHCTSQMFAEILEIVEPRLPGLPCRLFPSSFDPNDELLRAFPRSFAWHWTSCEQALKSFGAQVVLMHVPHFWQLGAPLNTVCRNIGAPIIISDPANLPVGAAAVVSAGVNAVVCSARGASEFASFLAERGIALPPLWFLVHETAARAWDVPEALTESVVAQEVHLFPGVPILEQCTALVESKRSFFHFSDAYAWETRGNAACVTSIGSDDPLPLFRFTLPFSFRVLENCACGKQVIEKIL